MSNSGRKLCLLIQQMCYNKHYDSAIKTGVRNRKIADEICEYKDWVWLHIISVLPRERSFHLLAHSKSSPVIHAHV